MKTIELARRLKEESDVEDISTVLPNSAIERDFFRFCLQGLEVKTSGDFTTWLREGLPRLLPHESFSCGLGHIRRGGVTPKKLINLDFPTEYFRTIKDGGGFLTSPIILRWLREREPQLFDLSVAKAYPESWVANFEHFNLRNIASHGLIDIDGGAITYFGFHRIPGKVGKRHTDMLKLLTPHLHQAFTKVVNFPKEFSSNQPNEGALLTRRELEVLKWICLGRSNAEIAGVMGISPWTVKRHVCNAIAKLHAEDRCHAVAIAMQRGIVDF